MNKEYTIIGTQVEVKDENGQISKRDNIEDIEMLLILENRIEQIEAIIKEENQLEEEIHDTLENYDISIIENFISVILSELITNQVVSLFIEGWIKIIPSMLAYMIVDTGFIIETIKEKCYLEKQQEVSKLINKLNIKELELIKQQISNLNIEIKTTKKKEIREIKEDPYLFDYIDRIGQLQEISPKKIRKLRTKKQINRFFDSIGCKEEDRKIYLEILGLEYIYKEESPVVKNTNREKVKK